NINLIINFFEFPPSRHVLRKGESAAKEHNALSCHIFCKASAKSALIARLRELQGAILLFEGKFSAFRRNKTLYFRQDPRTPAFA
ncbi:hypothetical protein, partial [Paenibacillus marchantiophytorum]|uniref:hypothetical protein n=1 Tax=Paenibacillus marchantiophytorum TaxID=1619310 RepID=UPI001E4F1FE0